MISSSAVGSSAAAAYQEMFSDTSMMPETGGFDFMNYLLGLTVSPNQNNSDSTELPLALLDGKAKEKQGDDSLLSIFGKKDPNALEMGLALSASQMSPNTALLNIPVKVDEKALNQSNLMGSEKLEGNQSAKLPEQFNLNNQLKLDSDSLGKLGVGDEKSSVQEMKTDEPAYTKSQKENFIQKYASKNSNSMKEQTAVETSTSTVGQTQQNTMKQSKENTQVQVTPEHHGMHANLNKEISEADNRDSKSHSKKEDLSLFNLGLTEKTTNANGMATEKMVTKSEGSRASLPEVFEKVQSMVHHGGGKMTVLLNPPSLGEVEIHVSLRGKNVEIEMKSDNDFAKQTLEASMNDLKSSMQAQDLVLSKLEVHVSRDPSSEFNPSQFNSMNGQESPYRQSDNSNRQNSERSNWNQERNQSQVRAIPDISANRITGRTASLGAGRVDIRI